MNEIERAKPSVLARVCQEILYRHEWLICLLSIIAFVRLVPFEFAFMLMPYIGGVIPFRFVSKELSPTNTLFTLLEGIPDRPYRNTRVISFDLLAGSLVYVRNNIAVVTESTLKKLTPEEAAWLIQMEAESAKHTLPTTHYGYLIGTGIPIWHLYQSLTSANLVFDTWKWVPIFATTCALFLYLRITASRFFIKKFSSIHHYEMATRVLRKLQNNSLKFPSRIFSRHSDFTVKNWLDAVKYNSVWLTKTLF